MAYDKVVDSAVLDGALTGIADAIRGKIGSTEKLPLEGMAAAIARIPVGGGGQYETGEIIGDGLVHSNIPLKIPVSFEPDLLFICLTDISTTLDANHVLGGVLIRDIMYQGSYRGANSANQSNGGFGYFIDGLTGTNTNKATYADGIVNWNIAPGSRPFYNGASYTWVAGKW